MSDADRLEKVVAVSLFRLLPSMHPDNRTTLIYLVIGLILGREVQLAKIAEQVNYDYKESSLEDRFRRFVTNENIAVTVTFSLFIKLMLAGLDPEQELVLSIDTSKSGGRCITLMVSLGYKSRALPLCWVTFKGRKGHSPEEVQLALLKTVKSLIPADRGVILLGDGEFDGSQIVEWLDQTPQWHYVCRTAKDILIYYQEEWTALQDIPLKAGQEAFFTKVLFTQANQVGPVNIMAVWVGKDQAHWFFVTNLPTLKEAKYWYRKRFKIETLFSDLKGRGFNLDKCRLIHPARVDRLLMAVAIAYLFVVFWGVDAIISGAFKLMLRTDRFDHSLFTLGFKYIHRLLKKSLPIPPLICFPPPSSFSHLVL
ncbi:MAG: IS4 family transposase [Candidatus Brocadiales bacterium]|nr:IS4 family transposase [Candidatus Bathyanammoxibius sp.]